MRPENSFAVKHYKNYKETTRAKIRQKKKKNKHRYNSEVKPRKTETF